MTNNEIARLRAIAEEDIEHARIGGEDFEPEREAGLLILSALSALAAAREENLELAESLCYLADVSSGGRISKPNYTKEVYESCFQDHMEERVATSVVEATEELKAERDALRGRVAELERLGRAALAATERSHLEKWEPIDALRKALEETS